MAIRDYIAYSDASKEAAWLRQLYLDIGYMDGLENESIILYGNNQACFTITKDLKHHGCTKAIDIRYYHVRDLIERGIVCCFKSRYLEEFS
jgi:hypothetical protein